MQFHLKNIKALEHGAFWLFIWLFVFDYHFIESNWGQAIFVTSMEVMTYAVIIYLNLLLLIPLVLKRKYELLYVASIVLTVAVYVLLLGNGLDVFLIFYIIINSS